MTAAAVRDSAAAMRPPAPPPRATESLRAYALAALHLFAAPADPPDDGAPELRFLAAHAAALGVGAGGWTDALARYLRHPAPADAPLARLATQLGLSAGELLTVAAAAAVDDSLLAGRAVARLQAPLGGSRPTVGLVDLAFAAASGGERLLTRLATGAALRSGVLTLAGDAAPFPEQPLAVPPHVGLALAGHDGACPGASVDAGHAADVRLPEAVWAAARRHAAALQAGGGRALVVRAGSPAEARAVAGAVAHAMGCRAAVVPLAAHAAAEHRAEPLAPGLAPWLLLRGLVPAFRVALGPGDHVRLPALPGYDGPVLVLAGPDGAVDADGATLVEWTLDAPDAVERRALWAAAVGRGRLADQLARTRRHGAGRIAALGRLARHEAALAGRARVRAADVARAAWSVEGGGLGALAEPVRDAIPDGALVTTPALRDALDALERRCHLRDGLARGLGAATATRYRPGVRALLVGPSGTGKSLAAAWLATRLGMPLYRVDLAGVTSKYIGETERNLASLFARAEHAEVVLLFDEADALFGKRTEVRDAHDRYANAQTNYLLQRLERYDGIVLLASNLKAGFDAAFSRRLDAVVEFPPPGPAERRALWAAHLGDGHTLTAAELHLLAARAELAGGHVRGAVLAAAASARAAGRVIGYADVVDAVAGEYRKLGRQLPADLEPGR